MSFAGMLSAREARWNEKTRLAAERRSSVVCMTLRMPINLRTGAEARAFFGRTRAPFERYCAQNGAPLIFIRESDGEDGPYCLWTALDADAAKRAAMAYEDAREENALLDIDVMDETLRERSRADDGRPPRVCLVCGGEDARACIREKRHTAAETGEACRRRMREGNA